jgi:hypothetical protein
MEKRDKHVTPLFGRRSDSAAQKKSAILISPHALVQTIQRENQSTRIFRIFRPHGIGDLGGSLSQGRVTVCGAQKTEGTGSKQEAAGHRPRSRELLRLMLQGLITSG